MDIHNTMIQYTIYNQRPRRSVENFGEGSKIARTDSRYARPSGCALDAINLSRGRILRNAKQLNRIIYLL